jgi:hypothetical protein
MNRSLGGAMGWAGWSGDYTRVPRHIAERIFQENGQTIGSKLNPDGTYDLSRSAGTRPPVKTIWDW